MGKKIAALRKELEALNERKEEICELIAEAEKELKIECEHCHKKFAAKNLIYIRNHRYIPPSGCMEGDYWVTSGGEFRCPSCKALNRLYYRPAVSDLKYAFKSIDDQYIR